MVKGHARDTGKVQIMMGLLYLNGDEEQLKGLWWVGGDMRALYFRKLMLTAVWKMG